MIRICCFQSRFSLSAMTSLRKMSSPSALLLYLRTQHKAAITIAMVFGTFIVTWYPIHVVGLLANFGIISESFFDKPSLLGLLAMCNSFLNPLIYIIRSDDFRDAIKRCFWSCVKKCVCK